MAIELDRDGYFAALAQLAKATKLVLVANRPPSFTIANTSARLAEAAIPPNSIAIEDRGDALVATVTGVGSLTRVAAGIARFAVFLNVPEGKVAAIVQITPLNIPATGALPSVGTMSVSVTSNVIGLKGEGALSYTGTIPTPTGYIAELDRRLKTVEANPGTSPDLLNRVGDHEQRIISLESRMGGGTGGGGGVVVVPRFAAASSAERVNTIVDEPVALPAADAGGPVDTYTLSAGPAAPTGTFKVAGVVRQLPFALTAAELSQVSVAYNATGSGVQQTASLILTATNAAGSAEHTVNLLVDIPLVVLTMPATVVLPADDSFKPFGITGENAEYVEVIELPSMGVYSQGPDEPALAVGDVVNPARLDLIGGRSGGASGVVTGQFRLRAANANGAVTRGTTVSIAEAQSDIPTRSLSPAVGAVQPLGIQTTISGLATVTAVPTTGVVEYYVPEASSGQTEDITVAWPLNVSPAASTGAASVPIVGGTTAPPTTFSKYGSGVLSLDNDGGYRPTATAIMRWTDAQNVDLNGNFDITIDYTAPTAYRPASEVTFFTWGFATSNWERFHLAWQPTGGDAASSAVRLYTYNAYTGTWTIPTDGAKHTLRLVKTNSPTDATKCDIELFVDGASRGIKTTNRPNVQAKRFVVGANIDSAGAIQRVSADVTYSNFRLGILAAGVMVPAHWEPIAANDTLTEAQLEGVQYNPGTATAGTSAGVFSWRGTTAAGATVGEDISITLAGGSTGGGDPGGDPGGEEPGGGGGTYTGADARRMVMVITPQDGGAAGTAIVLDGANATKLDEMPNVRGGVQHRWLLGIADLGVDPKTNTQTDQVYVYLTYIVGGEYNGRYEFICRMPYKTVAQGANNNIYRPYKIRCTWDGQPVTLFVDEPVDRRVEALIPYHSRGTGWRWYSQRIKADWGRLASAVANWHILPHNMNSGGIFTQQPGSGGRTVPHTADAPFRPFQSTHTSSGLTRDFRVFVTDSYRGWATPGDRAALGVEHQYAAAAIDAARKGLISQRDSHWEDYQFACDHFEQMPSWCFWNFSKHRALRKWDSGDPGNPYINHKNDIVVNASKNGIHNAGMRHMYFVAGDKDYGPGTAGSDMAHCPQHGFAAYSITGDPYYLELSQLWASFAIIHRGGNQGQDSLEAATVDEQRGFAWGVRNVFRAATITPADVPATRFITQTEWAKIMGDQKTWMRDELITRVSSNGEPLGNWFASAWEAQNFGFADSGGGYSYTPTTGPYAGVATVFRGISIYMMDYTGVTFGWAAIAQPNYFREYAEHLVNKHYRLRVEGGGGYLQAYAHASTGGIQYGHDYVPFFTREEEEGSLTPPYTTGAGWKAWHALHGWATPDPQYVRTDAKYGTGIRWQMAWGAINLLAKAKELGRLQTNVDLIGARNAFPGLIRTGTMGQIPLTSGAEDRYLFDT